MSIAPIGSPAYRAADAVLVSIDEAAEALVGDRLAFLPPQHGGPYDGVRVPRVWEVSPALEAAILEVLRAPAMGYATESWAQSAFGRKIEKAAEMRAGGHAIRIVGEAHWVEQMRR